MNLPLSSMWLVPMILASRRLGHEFEASSGYRLKARERRRQMWGNLLSENSVILATSSFPRIPSLGSGKGFPESPV